MEKIIDLRSDTVTCPTEGMRQAMAVAEVGDDVYGEDPTVNRLQEMAAEIFEREAALFVPSGSMGNSICLNVLARPGSEVICDRQAHIYNYEMASLSVISGLLPRVVEGLGGAPSAEQVESALRPDIYYLCRNGCVSLENTANLAGGRVFPRDRFRAVTALAQKKGLPVHLDGARIFNSAVAQGVKPSELAEGVDGLMFCLSKGLGAPVGSMVVGTRNFIDEARRVRKLLGGGMRQAGILAAAGIYALENNIERLAEDHANARSLAEGLAGLPGLDLDLGSVETNMLFIRLKPPAPDAVTLCLRLNLFGLRIGPAGPDLIRLVTHLDLSSADIGRVLAAFREALK